MINMCNQLNTLWQNYLNKNNKSKNIFKITETTTHIPWELMQTHAVHITLAANIIEETI